MPMLSARKTKHASLISILSGAIILVGVFITAVEIERRSLDPNVVEKTLISSDKMKYLHSWNLQILDCVTPEISSSCKMHSRFESTFPVENSELSSFSEGAKGHAIAVATYTLDAIEKEWLAKKENISLIIPRNVQVSTRVVGSPIAASQGIGTPSEIPFLASDLLRSGTVSLQFDFTGLPMFGPTDLPIALIDSDDAATFQSFPARQLAANHLVAQLALGFPLLICIMALVLDHSRSFGLLALYGFSRAIRTFVPFLSENVFGDTGWLHVLFFGFNGLCFATLVLFTMDMGHLTLPRLRNIFLFILLMVMIAMAAGYLLPNGWVTLDLYADAASSMAAVILVFLALRQMRQEFRDFRDGRGFEFHGTRLDVLTLVLILGAASVQAWVNIEDLSTVFSGRLKSIFDWRHMAIFPALSAAALFEVGFTSRRVQAAAKEIAEKAILDHEIQIAHEIQRETLPPMKCQLENWSWRAYHRAALRVGGDWFDVRELEFLDGSKLLVAAVVDLTGHGLGAALSTSLVSSLWSLWCQETALELPPRSAEERERFLATAPARLDAALRASRKGTTATGVFVLLDVEAHEVTFCTAGHPPILVSDNRSLRILQTPNPGLGLSDNPVWRAQTDGLNPKETLILYSDGIIGEETTVQSWLARLRRQLNRRFPHCA